MLKSIFETALTDYSSTDKEIAGVIRVDDNGKIYRWIKNLNASTAFVVGQPVCYDADVAVATRFQGVLACAAADQEMVAGCAMSAIPAGYYGWIQCKGVMANASVTGGTSVAIAIGDVLKVVSGGLTLVMSVTGNDIGRNDPFVALEAVATASAPVSAAIGVMLNCSY